MWKFFGVSRWEGISRARRQQAMAQRVITERLDDLDGSTADETVRFGYAGHSYEIDLTKEHANELDQLLSPYVEHARRVGGGEARPRRGRKAGSERRSPAELRAIRQWARERGLQVSDQGRIAADIVAKYEAAH
jgi:hypothetical protein